MLTYAQALEIVLQQNIELGTEEVHINTALGRVTASAIYTDRDYPPFNRAAMDGFAIKVEEYKTEKNKFKIIGELLAGQELSKSLLENLTEKSALRIMTGAAVPPPFNAIIKIEDCSVENKEVTFNLLEVKVWQHIAIQGEDAKLAAEIIPSHTEINLGTIIALASVGKESITVFKKPKIAVITTGNEIIPISEIPSLHQIRNSNVHLLVNGLANLGVEILSHTHVSDTPEDINKAIEQASIKADMVICTGGVSAGVADYLPAELHKLGFEMLFHKVKIKPGKPVWFGMHSISKTILFALPGNPLSILTTFKILVEPFLLKVLGKSPINYTHVPAEQEIRNNLQLDEFMLGTIANNVFSKIKTNGSGDVISSINANALALHPLETNVINLHENLKVYKFS